MAKRDLDVVVFGATSVTGRRVAAYLGSRAQEVGASWAAAGRDAGRVAAVLAEEGASAPETIVADVDDPGSLAAMAARARVVLNLVGPYTRYGRPVIEACVEGGAYYANLTGEIPFARRVIADFHAAAEAAGVKVIQPCGFESLPPDLAVALAERTARERWGEDLAEVDVTVSVLGLPPGIPRPSDMLSGGTLQSLAEAVGDPDARVIRDPACLIGDEDRAERVREISPIKIAPWRQDGAAIAPMAPAAFINPAVIHRGAALRQPPPRPSATARASRSPEARSACPRAWRPPAPSRASRPAFGGSPAPERASGNAPLASYAERCPRRASAPAPSASTPGAGACAPSRPRPAAGTSRWSPTARAIPAT